MRAHLLNTLLVSVWAILVTLGIFYLQQDGPESSDVEKAPAMIIENYRSGTVSTAVFDAGQFAGHFVTTVRFDLPKDVHSALQVPIEFIIGDQLFGILNTTNIEEIKGLETQNIQKISQKLEKALAANGLAIKNVKFEDTIMLPN